jgi:hypothetical protein
VNQQGKCKAGDLQVTKKRSAPFRPTNTHAKPSLAAAQNQSDAESNKNEGRNKMTAPPKNIKTVFSIDNMLQPHMIRQWQQY